MYNVYNPCKSRLELIFISKREKEISITKIIRTLNPNVSVTVMIPGYRPDDEPNPATRKSWLNLAVKTQVSQS